MTRTTPPTDASIARLQPAGRRWGFGAHSVVPYLAHSVSAAGTGDAAAIRNPVFPHMDAKVRTLRHGH